MYFTSLIACGCNFISLPFSLSDTQTHNSRSDNSCNNFLHPCPSHLFPRLMSGFCEFFFLSPLCPYFEITQRQVTCNTAPAGSYRHAYPAVMPCLPDQKRLHPRRISNCSSQELTMEHQQHATVGWRWTRDSLNAMSNTDSGKSPCFLREVIPSLKHPEWEIIGWRCMTLLICGFGSRAEGFLARLRRCTDLM